MGPETSPYYLTLLTPDPPYPPHRAVRQVLSLRHTAVPPRCNLSDINHTTPAGSKGLFRAYGFRFRVYGLQNHPYTYTEA